MDGNHFPVAINGSMCMQFSPPTPSTCTKQHLLYVKKKHIHKKTTSCQDWVVCDLQQSANLLSLEAGLPGNEVCCKASTQHCSLQLPVPKKKFSTLQAELPVFSLRPQQSLKQNVNKKPITFMFDFLFTTVSEGVYILVFYNFYNYI